MLTHDILPHQGTRQHHGPSFKKISCNLRSKGESAAVVPRLPEQGTPMRPSKEESAAAESRISEQEILTHPSKEASALQSSEHESLTHSSKEASAPSKEAHAFVTDQEVSMHPSKEASASSKETNETMTDQELSTHPSKDVSAETKLQSPKHVPRADKNPSTPRNTSAGRLTPQQHSPKVTPVTLLNTAQAVLAPATKEHIRASQLWGLTSDHFQGMIDSREVPFAARIDISQRHAVLVV